MNTRKDNNRRGVATVEFALTVPLLLMLVFAGVEFSRVNMLLHTAAIAATEGARRGIVAGATAEECYEVTARELETIGVNAATITVMPEVITDQTKAVTVGVMIPLGGENGYVTPRFFLGSDALEIVSVTREAQDSQKGVEDAVAQRSQAADDLKAGKGKKAGKDKGKDKDKDKEEKKKEGKDDDDDDD